MVDDEDAPPAVPAWEPSELAKRIAAGHAGLMHFEDVSVDDLARLVQDVFDFGQMKQYGRRRLYWDRHWMAVIVSPADRDGGTVFQTDREYVANWGDAEEVMQ